MYVILAAGEICGGTIIAARFPGLRTRKACKRGRRDKLDSPGLMPAWPSSGLRDGFTISDGMPSPAFLPEAIFGNPGKRELHTSRRSFLTQITLSMVSTGFG